MNKGRKGKSRAGKKTAIRKSCFTLLFFFLTSSFHASATFTSYSSYSYASSPGLQKELTREEMLGMGWIDKDGKARHDFKNIAQGAATSVWAATTPLLEGKGGLYCEDCHIGKEDDCNIFFLLFLLLCFCFFLLRF